MKDLSELLWATRLANTVVKEVNTEKDEYECKNIFRPHPDIEGYWVYSTRSTGIAMIKVRGGDVWSPSYTPDDPERIKTLTSKMANQLSEKYGEMG